MIPEYINCNRKGIIDCDYFWDKDCPETCAYSQFIHGGGEDPGLPKLITDIDFDKTKFQEDKNGRTK